MPFVVVKYISIKYPVYIKIIGDRFALNNQDFNFSLIWFLLKAIPGFL